jgi:hypothetical protein
MGSWCFSRVLNAENMARMMRDVSQDLRSVELSVWSSGDLAHAEQHHVLMVGTTGGGRGFQYITNRTEQTKRTNKQNRTHTTSRKIRVKNNYK